MKQDILLAGVGGQGILSMASILGQTALSSGLYIKQSEVHGMAQRGGAVQSHVRIASQPVASAVIPLGSADLVLALEPMEALRYLPWLSANGWIASSGAPVRNIAAYPDIEAVLAQIRERPRHLLLDTAEMARAAGSPRTENTILLGAASALLDLPADRILAAITAQFQAKGASVVEVNRTAFSLGREAGRQAAESR